MKKIINIAHIIIRFSLFSVTIWGTKKKNKKQISNLPQLKHNVFILHQFTTIQINTNEGLVSAHNYVWSMN